jgi:hypothetical protein
VTLPDLGIRRIKAKLDTGARTSTLHAFGMTRFCRDGLEMVRFQIHPVQRSTSASVDVEAEVIDERTVRSSGGQEQLRPVIETAITVGEESWPIELTLTCRDQMGFRLLLGRQALRGRALVDSATSFQTGRNPRHTQARHRASSEPSSEEE